MKKKRCSWLKWSPVVLLLAIFIPGVREWVTGEGNRFTAWFLTWHYYVQGAATGTVVTLIGTLAVSHHAWRRQLKQMEWDSRERRIQRNSDAREARRARNHTSGEAATERKHAMEKEYYFAFIEALSALTTAPEDYMNHTKSPNHSDIVTIYNSTKAKVRVIAPNVLYPAITEYDCSFAAHTSSLSLERSKLLSLHQRSESAKATAERYKTTLEDGRKEVYSKINPVTDTASYLKAIKEFTEAEERLQAVFASDAEAFNRFLEASFRVRDLCFKAYEDLLKLQVKIELDIKALIGTPIDREVLDLAINKTLKTMKDQLDQHSKAFVESYRAPTG